MKYFDHIFLQRLPDEPQFRIQVIFDTFFKMDMSFSTDDEKVRNVENYIDGILMLKVECETYLNLDVDISFLKPTSYDIATIKRIVAVFRKMREKIPQGEYHPKDFSSEFSRDFCDNLSDDPIVAAKTICDSFFEMNWFYLTSQDKLKNYDRYIAAIKCLNLVSQRLELKSCFHGFSNNKTVNINRIITFFMEIQEELNK